jgi:hypothetical protein
MSLSPLIIKAMKQSGIYQNLSYCTVILLLILSCQIGNTQTIEVSDDINKDTTWIADTVKILDDITVNPAYTLTINPGTYIEFQGHFKLEVQGRLLAIGTKDSNIIFTVNDTTLLYDLDTTAGGWNGIDFLYLTGDTSKLQCCILQYGKATDGDEAWHFEEDAGGAIFCRNESGSSPVLIKNCIIQNSIATEGGGIMLNQGNLILINNVIRYNRASYSSALVVGYSDALVDANIITNNTSNYGGIFMLENTNGLITNNLIVNNEIRTYSQDGTVSVNSASTSRNFSFYNNVVANNRSQGICGGIYIRYPNVKPPYKNNIIYNNQAAGQNYQFHPDTIELVEYNCIQGGYAGAGNIDADPLFVNPSAGEGAQYDGLAADWSLQKISPCIDAGKPDFTLDSIGVETDFAGSPRIQFDIIDIGSFEINYCTPVSESDPDNILINGSFGTCEILPWIVVTSDLLDKPASFRIIDGQCMVMPDGIDPQPEPSHIQLLQELSEPQRIRLETDSTYKLTFDAFAETDDRYCRVYFGMNEEPYTALLYQDVLIGKETQSFSFELTVSEIFPSMKFSFELGSDSSAVTFDNVRIIKIHGEVINDLEKSVYNTAIIYPNPADNYLKIFADKGSVIKLYNNLGIPVKKEITGYNNIADINTGNLPGGVYFIEISKGSKISVRKVIIR